MLLVTCAPSVGKPVVIFTTFSPGADAMLKGRVPMAVLLGNLGALAYADHEREEDAASSPQIITLSWLKEQTGKDDAWLNEQLDKGYTLYEIYQALQSGSVNLTLADDLNAMRVMTAEQADESGTFVASEEEALAWGILVPHAGQNSKQDKAIQLEK